MVHEMTCQEQAWIGPIGSAYTDRNTYTAQGLDDLYLDTFGVTRTALNWEFLGKLPRDLRILEVGCNIGMQLRHLQMMGFQDLHGVELQQDALDRLCIDRVDTLQGAATALPYPDRDFDLVLTSGLLIHISPDYLTAALAEIVRCTKKYIWGFEYFSRALCEIREVGWEDMLWSADYPELFLRLSDMGIVREKMMPGLIKQAWDIVGHMYLLRRGA